MTYATKKYYEADKAYYKRKSRLQAKKATDYVKSVKRKCARCPETFHRCLDFHHLKDKSFNVSTGAARGMSIASLKKEIAKCILLCSNCHRKQTYRKEFARLG